MEREVSHTWPPLAVPQPGPTREGSLCQLEWGLSQCLAASRLLACSPTISIYVCRWLGPLCLPCYLARTEGFGGTVRSGGHHKCNPRHSILHSATRGTFFFPRHVVCGILVPRQGIEPMPPALEARSLNHWTTREVPRGTFKNTNSILSFLCLIFLWLLLPPG